MHILPTIDALRDWRAALAGTVGFVPTMGYMHAGHIELVRRAREASDHVVVSIFVNPTQFGPSEDLSRYPRDTDRDLMQLRAAGVDAVFLPEPAEIYPPGFGTWVEVEGLTGKLEGKYRPGHFRGVATVVCKLLSLVRPDASYFGQKDAQQLLVIRRMAIDLNLPGTIVGVPTVREPDGLALSSRNVYLTPEQRPQALALSRALRLAEERFAAGERRASVIKRAMRRLIAAEPEAKIQYISIADATTLDEVTAINRPALVSLAVYVGGTRLIDNTLVHPDIETAGEASTTNMP